MKEIDIVEYKGYKLVLMARFVTDGYDASQSIAGSAVLIDCVELEGVIYDKNGINIITLGEVKASARTHHQRKFGFMQKQYLSIEDSFNYIVDKMKKRLKGYVDNMCKKAETATRDKEITDGLPDSLKGM